MQKESLIKEIEDMRNNYEILKKEYDKLTREVGTIYNDFIFKDLPTNFKQDSLINEQEKMSLELFDFALLYNSKVFQLFNELECKDYNQEKYICMKDYLVRPGELRTGYVTCKKHNS